MKDTTDRGQQPVVEDIESFMVSACLPHTLVVIQVELGPVSVNAFKGVDVPCF